jgi:opacity protein-like surface antigen
MKKIAITLIGLLAAVTAQAESANPGYALVGVGSARYNLDCTGTTRCSNNGTGFKLAGGWRVGNGMAVELGYLGLGKATASDSSMKGELKSTALTLGMAFSGEFSPNWTGVARLGLASVSTKIDAAVGSATGSASERKAQLHAGLGVAYAVNKDVSIEAAWDSTRAQIAGEKGNVSLLSVGVGFKF